MHRFSPLAAATVLGSALCLAGPAQAAPANVSIGEFFYKSGRVQIDPGQAVTWTNKGDVLHTVTSRGGDPERFDSDQLDTGKTFSRTFTKPGRYAYMCTLHPGLMYGVVQVGPDKTPAKLSKLKAKRGKKSVRLSFALSEDAKVKATITRSGKRVKTLSSKTIKQGSGSLTYKPRSLTAGRYKVKLVATDVAGNKAKAVSGSFSVPKK
jgi:plastocyanin